MSLTERQLDELKKDLLTIKENLKSQEEQVDKAADRDTGERSTMDNHLVDSADGVVNQEEQMAEESLRERRLRDIDEALVRMEEGTYGECVDTDKPIPFERLKAVPYAKRTVEAEEAYAKAAGGENGPADGRATSRMEQPEGETEDDRARTLERLEEEHNRVEP